MRISYNWLKEYVDVKLPPDELKRLFTMSGLSVESVEDIPGDHIFEIEVTSNRPDWLSVIGVAREVSALTGKKLNVPPIRHREAAKRPKQSKKEIASPPSAPRNDSLNISIRIEDKILCPKYTGRIIRDVNVTGSPAWLKTRLEAVGVRAINNIVDITNFCLFETGEPMHAFDLDKIEGDAIFVRKARKGEKLRTIDGIERSLDDSMVVIADGKRPIALAGVMGGLDTEVTASTKNILLEAASFDPISIRRASRKFALSTESSYRFERKVAIENIAYARDRATALISELAGGRPEEFFDAGDRVKPKKPIQLKISHLCKILGITVPGAKVKSILKALGLNIKKSSADSLWLEVPDFRNDLNADVDCIEEVARVYGYDKVPETIPTVFNQPTRIEDNRIIAKKIRSALTACGASEIISYSLLSRKSLAAARLGTEDVAGVRNPLSGEQEVMRSGLLPGMLTAILWNINRKNKDLKLFELGNIYKKTGDDKFEEIECLSLAMTGEIISGWETIARPVTFYDIKGLAETILQELGVSGYAFKPAEDPGFSNAECAKIELGGETIGIAGEVGHKITHDFDVKDKVYFCELVVEPLRKQAQLQNKFKAIPRYPSVSRDISIVVGKDVLHADLVSCIYSSAGALLKVVELADRYKGRQISGDKVSMTYRLEYQDPARTLEEKDIQDVHTRVLDALAAQFGAKLR